jgi:hypothetical protein
VWRVYGMSETAPDMTAQEWIDLRTRLFLEGELDQLASHFATPLDILLEGRVMHLKSQEDVRAGLAIRRQKLHEIGVQRMKGLVVAEGISRQGRTAVHVDWVYDFGPGCWPSVSRAVYDTIKDKDGLPIVQRVDFQSLAFSGVPEWFAVQDATKLRA